MYSPPPAAGEPANEEAKMENMASSPADPLLTSTAQVVTHTQFESCILDTTVSFLFLNCTKLQS